MLSKNSRTRPVRLASTATLALLAGVLLGNAAWAASAAELSRKSREALNHLVASDEGARSLSREARAILVFPTIVKGGFLFAGQFGDGTLFEGGKAAGYYRSVAVSYGFQAGAQAFGYALFFMNANALKYFRETEGFELGVGPSLTVLDQGMARALTTTTVRSDVYAIFFDQKGLMGGLGVQGTKITQIHPE
jgi:lipid-binding SYLF domain-containing protein